MSAEAATFPFPFQHDLYELFDPIFSKHTSLFSTCPGRGYPLRTLRHPATTSFLVAGSYMGIEPSVIPESIWSYLFKKLELHYCIPSISIKQVRVQLNRYGNKNGVHPLSLYPHTDSAPVNLRPIFINIPISGTDSVRTDFYEFLPTGQVCPIDDLFDIDGKSKAHSPLNLTSFLSDNKQYCDSNSLTLHLWRRYFSLIVDPGSFGTFRSDVFHAPHITSGVYSRNCVGIFIYYTTDSTLPEPDFNGESLFTKILSDSFHYFDNEPVGFI